MQKGLSAPLLLILVSIIGGIAYFGYFSNSNGSEEVKGAKTYAPISTGFSVLINSNGAWDFYEYLCKSLEECKSGLTSGLRYSVTSGGQTQNHEVVVAAADSWKDYQYVKVYAKPSWGSTSSDFELFAQDNLTTVSFNDSVQSIEAVLIPISSVNNGFVESLANFSAD